MSFVNQPMNIFIRSSIFHAKSLLTAFVNFHLSLQFVLKIIMLHRTRLILWDYLETSTRILGDLKRHSQNENRWRKKKKKKHGTHEWWGSAIFERDDMVLQKQGINSDLISQIFPFIIMMVVVVGLLINNQEKQKISNLLKSMKWK